jgi:hypothetical protein
MFPHEGVTLALVNLREQIANQTEWAHQHADELDNGEEELLMARKALATELMEEARQLAIVEEPQEPQGHWVHHEGGRKSETEIVIIGLPNEMDDYELASILGGGRKIRHITMTTNETFVSYHLKADATEGYGTASLAITNAGGPETVVTMARFNPKLHGHEADPDGPQPRYKPYPREKSTMTGR